jgi:uncharacterized protein YqjF (DUF2071 family)
MRKNAVTMKGTIERCWLFTFRAPEEGLRPLLPAPLEPVTRGGFAFWNVVVCRVGAMRPRFTPRFMGLSYWHVAYRLYARFAGEEGLYFVRSDCDSAVLSWMGNVMTNFNFHTAGVRVREEPGRVSIEIHSPEAPGSAEIDRGRAPSLSAGSPFGSVAEASAFLKYKPLGLSVGRDGRVNRVRIVRDESAWRGRAVSVAAQRWAFFGSRQPEPELCTEVEPIEYRWNRGEIAC